jgi:hypothetical protein
MLRFRMGVEESETPDRCREQEWLLKNSLTRNLQKLDRIRKLYKRFFPVSWTFSITRFSTFFRKTDFFNSHSSYHHLSQIEIASDNPCSRHLSERPFGQGTDERL